MASLLLACAVAVLPPLVARSGLTQGRGVLRLQRSSARPVRMQLVWGQEPEVEQRAASGAPSLMELSVSYGWCLSDVELAEMQSYQVRSCAGAQYCGQPYLCATRVHLAPVHTAPCRSRSPTRLQTT